MLLLFLPVIIPANINLPLQVCEVNSTKTGLVTKKGEELDH
jgi:hypothetical protein